MAKPGDRVYQIISIRLDADTGDALVHLRMGIVDANGEVSYSPSTAQLSLGGPEASALVELADAKLQADGGATLQNAARLPQNKERKSIHQRETAFAERKVAREKALESRSERPLTKHPKQNEPAPTPQPTPGGGNNP